MFEERLIPHGFVVQLHSPVHSPALALQERPLKELYLALSERFRYPQFELLPGGGGALLKEGDHRSCEIFPDRMVIREQPTQVNFDEFLDQVVPIAAEVKQRVGQHIWIFQQGILRYLLPFEGPVMPLLRKNLFALEDSDLEKFGRPVLGLCLRVEFPPLQEDPTQVQLRIEPYFREPRMLFLELSTRYLLPLQNPDDFAVKLRASYEFLKNKSCDFLQGTFSRQQER